MSGFGAPFYVYANPDKMRDPKNGGSEKKPLVKAKGIAVACQRKKKVGVRLESFVTSKNGHACRHPQHVDLIIEIDRSTVVGQSQLVTQAAC